MTLEEILKQLKKQIKSQNNEVVNCNDAKVGGGYYNFPHTRNYDSDLGFLIEMYKELTSKYNNLLISFDEFIEILQSILTQIEVIVTEEVNKLLQDGKIFLDTNYVEDTKTLQFIFKGVV